MNSKICNDCGVVKPIEDFGLRFGRLPNSYCKKCVNMRGREWYIKNKKRAYETGKKCRERNKEKYNRTADASRLIRDYGITIEQRDKMFLRGCQICSKKTHLCVDHNHATGKVRGCLCRTCNIYIGFLKENIKSILNLYNYLVKNNAL